MSTYVFGTHLSYHDYLQAKSFESTLTSDISKHARAIIASHEELLRDHISVSHGIASALSEGFEQLSFSFQGLSQQVSDLNATFQWGFGELLSEVGRVSDALQSLISISTTPAQTWAYEQFEIARDAFRKELYEEAIDYVGRAINGFKGNSGYRLEYRFHYLLGTIRVGSFRNHSVAIVDQAKAVKAFLDAAKYALHDEPKEAGRAYWGAGWAAYCRGDFENALAYSERAVSLFSDFAEGQFQVAKVYMHLGNTEKGLPALKSAIQLDRGYTIRAASDPDFRPFDNEVCMLLNSLRQDAKQRAQDALKESSLRTGEAERSHVDEFRLSRYADLAPAKESLNEAIKSTKNDTYYGYLDAIRFCARAKSRVESAADQFVREALTETKRTISSIDREISRPVTPRMASFWAALTFFGIIGSFVLGCTQCTRVYEANTRQEVIRKEAADRMLEDLRSRGYDPNAMTVQQGRNLGYRLEDLPPANVGSTAGGTWFAYVFWGTVLSIGLGWVGKKGQMAFRISTLEAERNRLRRISSRLRGFKIKE